MFFDFRWTLKGRDCNYKNLKPNQIVNHFQNNIELTKKVGLSKNLKNLVLYKNVDVDNFYPRCFDLFDKLDFEDFIEDFKLNKVNNVFIYHKDNLTTKTILQRCKKGYHQHTS